MGVDIQALKMLKICHGKHGDFGKTLTIGRQGMHSPKHAVEIIMGTTNFIPQEFSENLFLDLLGATSVDSIDASTYEKATLIADLNDPIPEDFPQFDSIFDGGCLEHIFNINEALKNLSRICKVGGQIIHILPTNNQCGHGFWQFSPELFFSLYSERNGYRDTEVFLGDTTDPNWTFKILPPEKGQRHDVQHPNPLYVMVRTVKAKEDFSHKNVQQSDYEYIWEQSK